MNLRHFLALGCALLVACDVVVGPPAGGNRQPSLATVHCDLRASGGSPGLDDPRAKPEIVSTFAAGRVVAIDSVDAFVGGRDTLWRVGRSGAGKTRFASAYNLTSLAVDADHVFFTDTTDNGSVTAVDKTAHSSRSVVEHQDHPISVVLDGGVLYWIEQGTGKIWQASSTDLKPSVLTEVSDRGLRSLRADASGLWFGGTDGNLYFVSKSGGEARKVATGVKVTGEMAVDTGALFIASDVGLLRYVKAGGECPRVLVADASFGLLSGVSGVTVSRDQVYFTSQGGSVARLDKEGGRVVMIPMPNSCEATGLAMDGAEVFALESCTGKSSLLAMPLEF